MDTIDGVYPTTALAPIPLRWYRSSRYTMTEPPQEYAVPRLVPLHDFGGAITPEALGATAECDGLLNHQAPTEGCECGLYCTYDVYTLLAHLMDVGVEDFVLAHVYPYGVTISDRVVIRSEHQQVLGIWTDGRRELEAYPHYKGTSIQYLRSFLPPEFQMANLDSLIDLGVLMDEARTDGQSHIRIHLDIWTPLQGSVVG